MDTNNLKEHFISVLAKIDPKTKMEDMNLKHRLMNGFELNDIVTANDLYETILKEGIDSLLRIPNLGRKSINEILEIFFINADYYSIKKVINTMSSVLNGLEYLKIIGKEKS